MHRVNRRTTGFRLPRRGAVPTIPSMTRYGPLGLLGSLFTRGFHLWAPLRTAHPHAGPGAHTIHCSVQSPAGPRAEGGADALGGAPTPSVAAKPRRKPINRPTKKASTINSPAIIAAILDMASNKVGSRKARLRLSPEHRANHAGLKYTEITT